MSDYTKTTDFSAKDALASGNPSKAAKGTEVDTELDNIATAVATKYDVLDRNVANGLCPLDASVLVPVANLPAATESAIGALELATAGETDAGTDDATAVTPLKLQQILDSNAGILEDIKNLASPGADRGLYWDNSDGALQFLTFGAGLTITPDTLAVNMLGLEALTDPGADRVFFWDDGGSASGFLTVTNGLEISTTNLQLVDKTASATDAIDISSGDITLDFQSLTSIDIAGLTPLNSLVVQDGGVLKQIDIQDMGVRVVNSSAIQTFALGDSNTLQVLTGSTDRIWDIPTNASVAFPIGAIVYCGNRDTAQITLSPNTSAVRLTCVKGSDVGPSAGDQTISVGGMGALVKVDTNEWMLVGDLD